MTFGQLINRAMAVMCLFAPLAASAGSDTEEWEFTLAPMFLWGISIDGEATIGAQTAPLELEFVDDVLENLDVVYTVHFEARKGKLTLLAEYQHVSLEPSAEVGPLEIDVEFDNTAAELGAGWEFFRDGDTHWLVLAGLRYIDQDVDVEGTLNLPGPPIGPGPLPIGVSGGDDWVHPFVGLRSHWAMNPRWTLVTRADFGYAGGDDRAVNLSFMFDYRFRDWGSAFAGYRYMDFDYEDGSGDDRYAYDAAQQGPLIGLSLYW